MPGNFIVPRLFIYVAGTPIDPNQNNPNENQIYAGHNLSMDNVTGHSHTGIPGDGGPLTITVPELPPVGTIIPWYDFGLLTFNPAIWHYCDGSAGVVVAGIGPQTLPDLSGRYLVGFGTDGGGNIGTVPFVAGAVGIAGSVLNLQHSHTENPHTHTVSGTTAASGTGVTGGPSIDSTDVSGGSVTGAGSAHNHGVGTLQFSTMNASRNIGLAEVYLSGFDAAGNPLQIIRTSVDGLTTDYSIHVGYGNNNNPQTGGAFPLNSNQDLFTANGTGSTANESAHTHSTPNHSHTLSAHTHTGPSHTHTYGPDVSTNQSDAGMSNALSAAQDIRPRSIPVRFLMRIA